MIYLSETTAPVISGRLILALGLGPVLLVGLVAAAAVWWPA